MFNLYIQLLRQNYLDTLQRIFRHHGFLEDISIHIEVFGDSRLREGFWQSKLHSFMPEGLNVRFVDPQLISFIFKLKTCSVYSCSFLFFNYTFGTFRLTFMRTSLLYCFRLHTFGSLFELLLNKQ